VILKEIKFRPKTDDHDFDFKVKHIRRFLMEGNKAKLAVIFRGREIVHPETGQDVLKRVVEATSDIAQVEQTPMMEGRRMLMIIAPRSGVIRAAGAPAPQAPRPATPPVAAVAPQAQAPRPAVAPQAQAARPQSAAQSQKPAAAPMKAPHVQVKPPTK
jgi:translation initiation factor IF-3